MTYNDYMSGKRRIGPRLGQSPRLKDAALMVRMTDEQLRRMQQRAAEEELSTSTWARKVLLKEIKDQGTSHDRDR